MRPAPSRLIIDSIDSRPRRLGHILFLNHLHARHFRERFDRHCMRLVPAEVVARTDINDANGQVLGRKRA